MNRSAVLLAGGSSRRMGTDKASLELDGVALIRRVVESLLSVPGVREVAVVGGGHRPALGGMASVAFVDDLWPGEGPLGGVVSGLRRLPGAAADRSASVVVVSCDLPHLQAESLVELCEALESSASADAAVSVFSARRQPLHAAYRAGAVDALADSFDRGNRRLERALEGLAVLEVPDHRGSSQDADTPEDWHRLVRKPPTSGNEPPRV